MSIENETPVEPTETNLDDFSAKLFGQKEADSEPASSEVDKESSEESDAPKTEDTHADAADTSAPDDDDETGEEEDSNKEEAPKPRKNRTQERIDELTKNWRETERKLEEALSKLADKENVKTEPAPVKRPDNTGPRPTDKNEDGTEKYPLGEFDPQYITDLADHRVDLRLKAVEEGQKKEQERKAREEAATALQESWNVKLDSAKDRYPDLEEKSEQIVSAFDGIDPAYGDYLASTIMDMDYGPDVLYYLANNVDEAKKIVQSGAKKATVALGRLEAKFAFADEEKQRARPKVSSAPPPPPSNKGSAVAAPSIRGDEPDINLDDFAKVLFKKDKR